MESIELIKGEIFNLPFEQTTANSLQFLEHLHNPKDQ